MSSRQLLGIFLLLMSVAANGQEINCDNYELEISKKIDDLPIGQGLYYGPQAKTLSLNDFFDPQWIEGVEGTVCKEKKTDRIQCWGEPFEITIYGNGIVIERGLSSDGYILHHNFPVTPRGIVRGMSRKQVIEILGQPPNEYENMLNYELTDGSGDERVGGVSLLFVDRKLEFIAFVVPTGICVE